VQWIPSLKRLLERWRFRWRWRQRFRLPSGRRGIGGGLPGVGQAPPHRMRSLVVGLAVAVGAGAIVLWLMS
jgi:hypothetical protein